MNKDGLIVEKQDGQGRPSYTDEQYAKWIDEMSPYLKMASTLYYACDKAGLEKHYFSILKKYKLNDWFSQKIDAYRRQVGERSNNSAVRFMEKIDEKIRQDIPLSDKEVDYMKWFNEKHRTAQPFFVTRNENVVADDKNVGKILDNLEANNTDYEQLGREAEKQVVANEQPVQSQDEIRSN